MSNISNLDELLDILTSDDDHGLDMCMLPTFGGTEPASTLGVWSWDASRVIIGRCSDDYRIVDRADHE